MSTQPSESPLPNARPIESLYLLALFLIILSAILFLIKELGGILQPLMIALFLSYIILPIHRRFTQWGIPWYLSIAFIVGIMTILVYTIGILVYENLVSLSEKIPLYEERATQMLQRGQEMLASYYPEIKADEVWAPTSEEKVDLTKLRQWIGGAVGYSVGAITSTAVITFYLFFLLMEASTVESRIRQAFTQERAEKILGVIDSISQAMSDYLWVKTKASLLLATPVTVTLWAFGLDFALMWGILTFFANFIPYVGSLVLCALPIILAYFQFESLWWASLLAVVLIIIHQVTGNVIEPRMTGKTLGISPLALLIFLAFWGLYWGFIGMVLAVPFTVMLKIVLENIEQTKFLSRLMSAE
ncbi:Hypothetical protein PBC10988_41000 [Planctomycetales bacterium 10988]|nr:Hypothetical protein PBC10988_41000 [Planctomycetales bacterium 10988]